MSIAIFTTCYRNQKDLDTGNKIRYQERDARPIDKLNMSHTIVCNIVCILCVLLNMAHAPSEVGSAHLWTNFGIFCSYDANRETFTTLAYSPNNHISLNVCVLTTCT